MNPELLKQARNTARMIRTRIHMRIPSVLARGERFSLDLSVTGSDLLPMEGFTNRLRLEGSVGIEGLPADFQFAPGESTGKIEGLTATGEEAAVVCAIVEGTGKIDGDPVIESNPAWIFDDPPYRVFWGDIHVHTSYSNCSEWRCLDPEWCYQYARDITFLDFTAPADHLRGIASDKTRWPRLQQLAREYNEPGRFATILAFESSHAQGFGGDNNVYFLDDDSGHFWVDREDMHGTSPTVHLRDMWLQLDANGSEYITVPHHTGRGGKYRAWHEDYHEPTKETLFEVFSSWGSSEMRHSRMPMSGGNNNDDSYFVDALKAGARYGLIASSDDHATLPGAAHHHRVDPFESPNLGDQLHHGLAAIRAPELTREALFHAMKRRDTYATTIARSLVDVRIGGAGMGQEIPADASLRNGREINVRLTLDGSRNAKVVLMRNGEEIAAESIRRDENVPVEIHNIVFGDTEPLEKTAIRDARYHPDPFTVYYVRIEDNRGVHNWTSPIWIDGV
jgi:hypothetical protein